MAATQTGTEHQHEKEALHKFTWRGKRNPWTSLQIVCVTERIRGLLATAKLVRGRKRREWLARSATLQGW